MSVANLNTTQLHKKQGLIDTIPSEEFCAFDQNMLTKTYGIYSHFELHLAEYELQGKAIPCPHQTLVETNESYPL